MAWKDHTASRMVQTGIAWMLAQVVLWGLSGCSDDSNGAPDVSLETTAISFSSELASAESVTRAASTIGLEDYKNEFRVWCYKEMPTVVRVMDDYVVRWAANTAYTTVTNTHDWEYVKEDQPIRYWDWGAAAYRFFGLADASSSAKWTSVASEGSRTFSTAVNAASENIPYYSKLWYSTGNAADYPGKLFGQPVQLEFLQPLTRVRFYFVRADVSADVTVASKSLKPASGERIATVGTFTVTYPTSGAAEVESWTVVPTAGTGLAAFTEDYYRSSDATVPANPTTTRWYTVLPRTGQGAFVLTVTINGEVKTATVPAQYTDWQPNYEYTYIFKITDTSSVKLDGVEMAFSPWVEDEAGEHEIYNW